MQWFTASDTFAYKVTLNPNPTNTKRSILLEISLIFDPLDLIKPVISKAKIFLQQP